MGECCCALATEPSSLDGMTTIREAHATFRFRAVGQCIYCGNTSGPLSDEHIIPYALRGNMILPEASCEPCAAITSLVERRVLRGFMLDARTVGNFPTRRKKERPQTIRVSLLDAAGATIEREVPVSEGFAFLVLPTFVGAAVLSARPATRGITVTGQETLHFGRQVDAVAKLHGATGVRINAQIPAGEFAKFLAKIAYAYYVAEFGVFPRDETPLLSLITGEADDPGSWVGSSDYRLQIEEKRPTHALGIMEFSNEAGLKAWAVRVKLFADAGTTGYEVAVRIPGWRAYSARPSNAKLTIMQRLKNWLRSYCMPSNQRLQWTGAQTARHGRGSVGAGH